MNNSKKGAWILFLVGIVFISLPLFMADMPPLASLEKIEGVVTASQRCTCSSNKGRSSGYTAEYKFSYNNQEYEGAEKGCSCGSLVSNNPGESITILFDKNNPENNIPLSSVLFFSIFIVLGLGCLGIGIFTITRKQSDATK